jgi:hypothetical protein
MESTTAPYMMYPLGFFGVSLLVCAYGTIVTALSGLGNDKAGITTSIALVGWAIPELEPAREASLEPRESPQTVSEQGSGRFYTP